MKKINKIIKTMNNNQQNLIKFQKIGNLRQAKEILNTKIKVNNN